MNNWKYAMKPICLMFCVIPIVVTSCRRSTSAIQEESGQPVAHTNLDAQSENIKLVDALKALPVTGASIGPETGITSNSTTTNIVSKGKVIVPVLVSALDNNSWTQDVWIVFCLRQMRAPDAKDRLLKLQNEIKNGRFWNQGYDFTLQTEIQSYLETVGDFTNTQPQP
jgi:hypothetical protein